MDELSNELNLLISCSNLRKADVMSKSDPIVIVSLEMENNNTEVGRTEIINNNSNPKFQKAVKVTYYFERLQTLTFAVYDCDDGNVSFSKELGSVRVSLGSIAGARNQTVTLPLLYKEKQHGEITVSAELVGARGKDKIQFLLSASHLDKKDLLGKSDPYLKFIRNIPDGPRIVHSTQVIKSNLNPNWGEHSVIIDSLCGPERKGTFKIQCWDWDRLSKDDLIGETEVQIQKLLADVTKGENNVSFPLVHPEKASKKKSYTDSGKLQMSQVKIIKEYSFLDYLQSGLDMKLMVAVDFTASNGNFNHPASLHFYNPSQTSDYVKALTTVSSILLPYSFAQSISAYGFGCKVGGNFSDCFALNFDEANPNVAGIQGLVDAYQNALPYLEFHGPTNFEKILDKAVKLATEMDVLEGSAYVNLIILTDGKISDFNVSLEKIASASNLPLSIVVIGIGNDDFGDMERLDDITTTPSGKTFRDIVQFVAYRDFKQRPLYEFAKEVLFEIPHQCTEYMKLKKVVPRVSNDGARPPPIPHNIVEPPWKPVQLKDPLPRFCKNSEILRYYGPYSDASREELQAISLELNAYGNPSSPMFDLGNDGAFVDFSILIACLFDYEGSADEIRDNIENELAYKGFQIQFVRTEDELINQMDNFDEVWVISHNTKNHKTTKAMKKLFEYNNKGKGVAIFGDNDPWFASANEFLKLLGFELIGNTPGGKVLTVGSQDVTGQFGNHLLTTGTLKLFEGCTLSYPNELHSSFELLATSSDGHPLVIFADNHPFGKLPIHSGRIVVDTAFTKLYNNWDSAGTPRYISNLAVWLLGLDNRLNNQFKLKGFLK